MPTEGEQAPDFTLEGVDAKGDVVTVRLSALRGRPVVLYFYPKDDTPGCTTQACAIRDEWPAFGETEAVVLGVSPDDVASHERFRAKYDLPFTLLADPDHAVAEAYGVWKRRSLYGRLFWGIERSTFVLDREGRIVRALRRVKPKQHADQVLETLA